jgi:hypothetical protein
MSLFKYIRQNDLEKLGIFNQNTAIEGKKMIAALFLKKNAYF